MKNALTLLFLSLLFSSPGSYAQALSLDDLLTLDTLSANSAIPFLESKGYRLSDTLGSNSEQVVYRFTPSNVVDTTLYRDLLSLYRSRYKKRTSLNFLSYETPYAQVSENIERGLADQKFKFPKKKNSDFKRLYFKKHAITVRIFETNYRGVLYYTIKVGHK